MPDVELAILALAKTHAGLTALIGAGTDIRLYYGALKDATALPAVAYALVSDARDHIIDSRHPRYQFTAWAVDNPGAGAVIEQLLDCFVRYKGVIGGVTVIQGAIAAGPYDMDPDPDLGRYGRAVDLYIHHKGA